MLDNGDSSPTPFKFSLTGHRASWPSVPGRNVHQEYGMDWSIAYPTGEFGAKYGESCVPRFDA